MKFTIWKHDCEPGDTFYGSCEPFCDDPWQVDPPKGMYWSGPKHATFATQAEAVAFALSDAAREGLMPCTGDKLAP